MSSSVIVVVVCLIVGIIGAMIFVQGLNFAGTPNLSEAYLGVGIIFVDIIVTGFVLWTLANSE